MHSFTTISALVALASGASAHMIMASPQPYNPPPTNSNLDPSGSNFPCQKTSSGFTAGSNVTKAAVGSNVFMSFTGTAVHGGGSCQVSLTKDMGNAVNANSQFKVIYSIEGGCPGTDGGSTTYNVPIPKDVPAGSYTYAWTWYNRIGNREIYMNCAPIDISGSGGSDSTFNALPDMAIYNINSKNQCKTVETTDVQFANPGQYVLRAAGYKPAPPTGNCAGSSNAASGSGSSGSAGSGSVGTPSVAPAGSSTFNNGQYTPQATSAAVAQSTKAAASPTSLAISPIASSAAQSQAPAAPSAAPSASGSLSNGTVASPSPGAGTVSGTSCSPDGALVCSDDGTQFALCNWGKAAFQAVAAGTKCSGGAIMKRRGVPVLWSA